MKEQQERLQVQKEQEEEERKEEEMKTLTKLTKNAIKKVKETGSQHYSEERFTEYYNQQVKRYNAHLEDNENFKKKVEVDGCTFKPALCAKQPKKTKHSFDDCKL